MYLHSWSPCCSRVICTQLILWGQHYSDNKTRQKHCKKRKLQISISHERKCKNSKPALAAPAKSLQSCPTPCYPIDGSPPGSTFHGIIQVRTLEWVAISFSNAWKWKVEVKSLGHVRLLATPWTAAHQAPPSMGFSRQEYWSGVPLPSLILSLILAYWI